MQNRNSWNSAEGAESADNQPQAVAKGNSWIAGFTLSAVLSQKVSVFLAALTLAFGTAGFLGVRMLTTKIEQDVKAGAIESLGGEFEVSDNRMIPEGVATALVEPRANQVRVSQSLSMAYGISEAGDVDPQVDPSKPDAQTTSTLVEVVAVSDGFPLREGPVTAPADAIENLGDAEVVIDRSMAETFFGASLFAEGNNPLEGKHTIEIAGAVFKVVGEIIDDPTRRPMSLVTGPRVYIRRNANALNLLFSKESRIQDRILYQSKPQASLRQASSADSFLALETRIKTMKSDALEKGAPLTIRSRDSDSHAKRIFRPLRRFTLIVEIVGLATLLLSLFGGGFAVTQLLNLFQPQVALLKALGARPLQSILPAFLCILAISLVALILGTGLSIGVYSFLGQIVSEATSGSILRVGEAASETQGAFTQFYPFLKSVSFVCLFTLSVLFVYLAPTLISLSKCAPLQLLEDRQQEPNAPLPKNQGKETGRMTRFKQLIFSPSFARLALLFVIGTGGAAFILGNPIAILAAMVGLAAVLAVLLLISTGIFKLLAKTETWLSPELQVSLLGTLRHQKRYRSFIATLGFALTLAFFVSFMSQDFLAPLQSGQNTERPNIYFLDVQSTQKEGFAEGLKSQFKLDANSAPVVRARITRLNGERFSFEKVMAEESGNESLQQNEAESRRRRFLTREQNLSYTWNLPDVSEGQAWKSNEISEANENEIAEVSMEEGFADTLGVELGDKISFNVQGFEMETTVTSFRTVEWESGQLNFFIIAHPSLLEQAPQQHLFTAQIDESMKTSELTGWLRQNFANVTYIDLRQVVEKLGTVIEKMMLAIGLMVGLCYASALTIFMSTLVHLRYLRLKDAALLRLLGGRSKMIRMGWALEFSLLSITATLCAFLLSISLTIGWSLALFKELPKISVAEPLTIAFVTVVLSSILGLLTSKNSTANQPLEALRASEELSL